MKLTIEIHDAWLGRLENLRKILATIAGLECPPTGAGAGPRPAHDPREDLEEPFDPEERPRGRNGNGRYPGDDDRNQASDDIEEEDPPCASAEPRFVGGSTRRLGGSGLTSASRQVPRPIRRPSARK